MLIIQRADTETGGCVPEESHHSGQTWASGEDDVSSSFYKNVNVAQCSAENKHVTRLILILMLHSSLWVVCNIFFLNAWSLHKGHAFKVVKW